MSRTYKTSPFWVKMKQGHLATTESHDHREGPCDLPAEITEDYWRRTHHCRTDFVYTGIHVCCCAMCHGDYSWFAKKRGRLRGKMYAKRDWTQEYGGEGRDCLGCQYCD